MWCSRNGAQNACRVVILPHGHQLVCTVCKWTWRNHENIYDCERPTTACVLHTLKNTHNQRQTSARQQCANRIQLCSSQWMCRRMHAKFATPSAPLCKTCVSMQRQKLCARQTTKHWPTLCETLKQDNSPVRCRHWTPTTRVGSQIVSKFFLAFQRTFDLRYKKMFVCKVRGCLFPVQEMT